LDRAARVGHDHGAGRAFHGQAKALVSQLSEAEIAVDGADTAKPAVWRLDGRKCHRYVFERAILSAALGFHAIDALAAAQSLRMILLFRLLTLRCKHHNGLADSFLGVVAEQFLGTGIPSRIDALGRGGDDSVMRRFDGSDIEALLLFEANTFGNLAM